MSDDRVTVEVDYYGGDTRTRRLKKLETFANRYSPEAEIEYRPRRAGLMGLVASSSMLYAAASLDHSLLRARRGSTGNPKPLDAAGAARPKQSKRQARRARAKENSHVR